jgi:hypothetical protein
LALDYFHGAGEEFRGIGAGIPHFGCVGASRIELREKLVSVDLVQYRDSDGAVHLLVEDADYIVDRAKQPGLIAPMYGATWPEFTPWPSSAVLIRFTAGLSPTEAFWNDAGKRVLLGMKYLIAHWFIYRTPIEIVRGTVEEYPFSVTQNLSFGANPRVR